jgi:hypothetical protein
MTFHRKTTYIAITVAASWLAVLSQLLGQSPNTTPNVIYTASGTFATPQISGDDTFRLAGEPFRVTVIANTATVPHAHGAGWADYTGLRMQGTVHSGLDPTGVPLTSRYTFMALALGNPNYDLYQLQAPVIVIKQKVTISANIQMPFGTIAKWTIHPFSAPVTLTNNPSNATVTYVNGTDSTTLQVASGTLTAAYPTKGSGVELR